MRRDAANAQCAHRRGLAVRYRLARREFTLDVDFALPSSGVTGLFGPSGSGKTTLLRCLAGLEPAAVGRFVFDARVIDDTATKRRLPPAQRGIGIVFQEPRLFAHLDVERNLRYGEKRRQRDAFVAFEELVELLDIAPLLGRRASALSGGETQRVAIARALMSAPRLLLLDEPLASLDRRRREAILPFLEKLHARLPIPMIYVTHRFDEILRLADTLLVLDAGSRIAGGRLDDVLADAAASGLGSANVGVVLEGTAGAADAEHGMTPVATPAGVLWVTGRYAMKTPLRLVVRANDVSISLAPLVATSIQNSLPAQVVSLDEEAGATLRLALDAAGHKILARITRRAAARLGVKPGMPVYAHIKSVAVRRHRLAGVVERYGADPS